MVCTSVACFCANAVLRNGAFASARPNPSSSFGEKQVPLRGSDLPATGRKGIHHVKVAIGSGKQLLVH